MSGQVPFNEMRGDQNSGLNGAGIASGVATGAMGVWVLNWAKYQMARYADHKANKAKETTTPSPQAQERPAFNERDDDYAKEILLTTMQSVGEMRDWMRTEAGPIQTWDGDFEFNLSVVDIMKDLFPEVYEAWRVRNYL